MALNTLLGHYVQVENKDYLKMIYIDMNIEIMSM